MPSHEDIDRRSGWPDELRALLDKFPRASWQQNMTPLAQFWIHKHDDFRGLCSTLQTAAGNFRERSDRADVFAKQIASRTYFLVSLLRGHHQIEDFHYFPAFRAAEPRLGPGFDVLASDHELLHGNGVLVIESLNAFRLTLEESGQAATDSQRRAADHYIEASCLLCTRVVRHLEDEEDLVIPLMLAHG